MLDEKQYHLIDNITLQTRYGTTQIDHVIVSVYGIFVIETKNMKGWIFGKSNQSKWTQVIYRRSYKFQNPLHQNYRHVKILKSILGLTAHQMYSVIVFVGNNEFKTRMPENVMHGADYIDFINSKKRKVLTEAQVSKIIEKIETVRMPQSRETDRRHAKYVRNVIEEKESHYAPSCPRCGGFMVLRKVKRGENKGQPFWGCKRYPYCRGLRNIT